MELGVKQTELKFQFNLLKVLNKNILSSAELSFPYLCNGEVTYLINLS